MTSATSVVMPHFNHGAFVGIALTALLTQDLPPTEIIVVDDASRPEERAALAEAARQSPVIRVEYLDENLGPLRAVERGLALATGEFIYLASADDQVRPGLLATLVPALQADPALGLACGRVGFIDGAGAPTGVVPTPLPRATPGAMTPAEVRARLALHGSWFIGNATVYRADALREAGGLSDQCGAYADGAAAMLIAAARGVYFTPAVLSDWRRTADSYSAPQRQDLARVTRAIWGAHALLAQRASLFAPRFLDRWVSDELRRLYCHQLQDTLRLAPAGGIAGRVLDRFAGAAIALVSAVLITRAWGPQGAYHLFRARLRARRGDV